MAYDHDIPIIKDYCHLSAKERSRHVYVIGKTGMGKSTLLENMAIADIENGAGVVFIDPHGPSALELIKHIPRNRINDVLFFNLLDTENPPAWNLLHNVPLDERHLVADGITTSCRYTWPDVWGEGRMQYLAFNTFMAIADMRDGTLHDCLRMYVESQFRNKVIDRIENDVVRDFWVHEFPDNERVRREWVGSVQNKLNQLFTAPPFMNILGQVRSSFDLQAMMDNRKIVIVNLAKGAMGYRAKLLGSFLLVQLYLAAMRRALEAQATGREPMPCYVYVDEAGSFPPEIFADILSEARKGGLSLTIAHQYLSQLTEEVRDAIIGNVATMVCFRISKHDANILGAEFPPLGDGATPFPVRNLAGLGAHEVYVKYDGDGRPDYIAGGTEPRREVGIDMAHRVIERSREQFTKPRAEVEELVRRRRGGK